MLNMYFIVSLYSGIEEVLLTLPSLTIERIKVPLLPGQMVNHIFLPEQSLNVGKLMEVRGRQPFQGLRKVSTENLPDDEIMSNTGTTHTLEPTLLWEKGDMRKCTSDIFVFENGNLALAHNSGKVLLFDKNGTIVKDSSTLGIVLNSPTGIDLLSEENALVVCEYGRNGVALLQVDDLQLMRRINLEGMMKPYNIKIIGGNFVISYKCLDDTMIAIHDTRGHQLKKWKCYTDTEYKYPGRLGVDYAGHILLSGLDKVRTYDVKGRLLRSITVDLFTMGCASLMGDIIVAVSETGEFSQ